MTLDVRVPTEGGNTDPTLAMFAPGVPELMVEFEQNSRTLGSFVVSVYVLGFAAGPMVFAPLSELYGRLIVYHASNVVFLGKLPVFPPHTYPLLALHVHVFRPGPMWIPIKWPWPQGSPFLTTMPGLLVFTIACAKAPSFSALIGFRFLAGLFGSVPITNAGGTIADMIVPEKRGLAMAGFAMGPVMGPVVGPVAGGYLSDALGWRWVFWLLAILSGASNVVFLAFARETYVPVLLEAKARRLRKETGNQLLRSKMDSGLQPRDLFKRGIIRPCKMLFLSPICVASSFYVGIAYAYMYLMFASMATVYQQVYGFNAGQAGLTFIGLGVGSLIGVILFSATSDRYMHRKIEQERMAFIAAGKEPEGHKPEYRLPLLKVGGLFLPAGLFIYGWTADYAVHWIAPIIGTSLVGLAMIVIFMVCTCTAQYSPAPY